MKNRKTVSDKNRKNAEGSTGPRTERGKNASKFNAVKLGLFAKHIVIPLCDGDGSEVEFATLFTDLQQEYQPEGPSEEFWVVQIAGGMWELRRVARAEKGWVSNAAGWEGEPPDTVRLAGPTLLFYALAKKERDKMKTDGTLSPKEYAAIRAELPPELRDMAESEVYDYILAILDEKVKQSVKACDAYFRIAQPMQEDYYAAHALPPEAAMNSILRCERRAQKKLDWALQKLLESQRRRQKIPKPS